MKALQLLALAVPLCAALPHPLHRGVLLAVRGTVDGGFYRPGPLPGVAVVLAAAEPGCGSPIARTVTDSLGAFLLSAWVSDSLLRAEVAQRHLRLCIADAPQNAARPLRMITRWSLGSALPDTVTVRCSLHDDQGGPTCRPVREE